MATRAWRRDWLGNWRKDRKRDRWGDRDRPFPQRWRRRPNAVSALVSLIGTLVTLVLVAGVVLTWAKTNPNNDIVHDVLRAARWLATPFHGVFTGSDARRRLIENWLFAAAVYFAASRVLSRLLRW
jgi:hypothetical protein